jgi:hypothetical protein
MFQYLHPVDENVVSIGRAQGLELDFTAGQYPFVYRLAVQSAIAGFVLSTALLFGPLLVLLRRWPRRPAAPPWSLASSAWRCRP